jgi:hypothetical protein
MNKKVIRPRFFNQENYGGVELRGGFGAVMLIVGAEVW